MGVRHQSSSISRWEQGEGAKTLHLALERGIGVLISNVSRSDGQDKHTSSNAFPRLRRAAQRRQPLQPHAQV